MKRLLFYFSLVLFASCRKPYDNSNQVNKIVLPNYSETGTNSFGFMLNNTVWTIFGKHHYNRGFGNGWLNNVFEGSTFYTDQNQLAVTGGGRMTIVKNDSAIVDISAGFIFVPTLPYTKNYYLTTADDNRFAIFDLAKDKYYKVDTLRPLTLQLNKFEKIDSLWRICSGRFFGVVHNEIDPSDSIVITDGRFDAKIIYK